MAFSVWIANGDAAGVRGDGGRSAGGCVGYGRLHLCGPGLGGQKIGGGYVFA